MGRTRHCCLAALLVFAPVGCKDKTHGPTVRNASDTTGRPASDPRPVLDVEVETWSVRPLPTSGTFDSYALEGRAALPTWGRQYEAPDPIRDDDLATRWSCEPGEDGRPCAVGVEFPEPAEVVMVRFQAGVEDELRSYDPDTAKWEVMNEFGTPRRVRLHTDGGSVDAGFEKSTHQYVALLSEPVETRSLYLEFVEMYEGDTSHSHIHVGEVEVFGTSGEKRAPLEVDPTQCVVSFEDEAFSGPGMRTTWITQIDGKGGSRRIWYGTDIVGEKGDRFMLIEQMLSFDCDGQIWFRYGSYILLDRETRHMFGFELPDGEVDHVWTHPQQTAFAWNLSNWILHRYDARKLVASEEGVTWTVESGDYDKPINEGSADERGIEVLEGWGFVVPDLESDPPGTVDPCYGEKGCDDGDDLRCERLDFDEGLERLPGYEEQLESILEESEQCDDHESDCFEPILDLCSWGTHRFWVTLSPTSSEILLSVDEAGEPDGLVGFTGLTYIERPPDEHWLVIESDDGTDEGLVRLDDGGKLTVVYPDALLDIDYPGYCQTESY